MTTQNTMTPIRPAQLIRLLDKLIPARLPLLISSSPGVGKTSIVKQAALAANADCVVMHPVVSDPTDFKGMPWVNDKGAEFIPFAELALLMNAKKLTVAFIDDFGQATPAVQAAAMQLIGARQINGHAISDNVVFVAATNRRTDRAGVQGLLEPVKRRFITSVELQTHIKDWSLWANGASVEPVIIAFLNFRPNLLLDFQPTADMTNSPSPATWHSVSTGIQAFNGEVDRDLQIPMFEGSVGKAAAAEFVAFMRIWQDMVSPDVILATPDTAPIPAETSALYACAMAIATKVQKESMGRFCRYLERLIKEGRAEFAALSLQAALARDPKLTNTAGYVRAATGPIGQLLVGGA